MTDDGRLSIIMIAEDTAVGSTIYKASALDRDSDSHGEIQYFIYAEHIDDSNIFIMDKNTGDLLLWSQLDYDVSPQGYNLTLTAEDSFSSLIDTIWVYIQLTDVNDETPIFSQNTYNFNVDENVATFTTVNQVFATYLDSGNNGQIVYTIQSGDGLSNFAIDADGYNMSLSDIACMESRPYASSWSWPA